MLQSGDLSIYSQIFLCFISQSIEVVYMDPENRKSGDYSGIKIVSQPDENTFGIKFDQNLDNKNGAFSTLEKEDVFFDPETEYELVEEVFKKAKLRIEKLQRNYDPSSAKRRSPPYSHIFQFIGERFNKKDSNYLIFSGQKPPTHHELVVARKYSFYNIFYTIKEYKEILSQKNKTISFFIFSRFVPIGEVYPLAGRSGGKLYYYHKFCIQSDASRFYYDLHFELTHRAGRMCQINVRASNCVRDLTFYDHNENNPQLLVQTSDSKKGEGPRPIKLDKINQNDCFAFSYRLKK